MPVLATSESNPRHLFWRTPGVLACGVLAFGCADAAVPGLAAQLASARSPEEIAPLARRLVHLGPRGIQAVSEFAEGDPLVAFEPEHRLLVMYDSDEEELWYEEILPPMGDGSAATIEAAMAEVIPRTWSKLASPLRGGKPEVLEAFQSGERHWFVLRKQGSHEHFGLAANFRGGRIEGWGIFDLTEDQIEAHRTGASLPAR